MPAYFQIRKNEDRRERLTFEKNGDGSLKIVNALGADIRRVCFVNPSGHVFDGQDIPAGAERTLAAAPTVSSRKGSRLLRRTYSTVPTGSAAFTP